MASILIQHRVDDYDAWKPYFDDHATTRAERGSQGYRLFRSADDPSSVTILFEWDDMESAKSFAHDPELRELMAEAGVVGEPTITFLDEAEATTSEPAPV